MQLKDKFSTSILLYLHVIFKHFKNNQLNLLFQSSWNRILTTGYSSEKLLAYENQ